MSQETRLVTQFTADGVDSEKKKLVLTRLASLLNRLFDLGAGDN
jgi:hypothetical protein